MADTATDMAAVNNDSELQNRTYYTRKNTDVSRTHTQDNVPVTMPEVHSQTQTLEHKRYPSRERKKPDYLSEYVSGDNESDDQVLTNRLLLQSSD